MIDLGVFLDAAIREGIGLGEVFEIHLPETANPTAIGFRPLEAFIFDWGYALVGRKWNEGVPLDDLPPIRYDRAYIAIVHPDGAYLREV